ncbi:MAG: acyl-homoserine-lactone synthase [Alphaproteobacteria bacterium]|nr:acyl-homoserine-lactone synthase [Alphaproteobacteria bacterium]
MIKYITQKNIHNFSNSMTEYFHHRKLIFSDKLKWTTKNLGSEKEEKDNYDTDQAEYLLYVHPKYGACGGVRFIPTTGNYMLPDVFSYLIEKHTLIPKTEKIWESSRFFANIPPNSDNTMMNPSIILFLAMIKFGLEKNIDSIITVMSTSIERLSRKAGWPVHRLSEPKKCPENQEITSVAGILEVSMDCYNTIFEKANSGKQSCVDNFLS